MEELLDSTISIFVIQYSPLSRLCIRFYNNEKVYTKNPRKHCFSGRLEIGEEDNRPGSNCMFYKQRLLRARKAEAKQGHRNLQGPIIIEKAFQENIIVKGVPDRQLSNRTDPYQPERKLDLTALKNQRGSRIKGQP